MKFNIPDMSCDHCKAAITTAIEDLDEDAELSFDMEARLVSIETEKDAEEVSAVLKDAGYESRLAE